MTNFFINNGNKIDLLYLKEGKAINSDDEFLKKYDTNNNSIWDSEEINQFMSDLDNADINGDGKIDNNESISWYSKITNTSINKIQSLFKDDDTNKVYQSLGNIIRENAEETSITRISQNAKEGLNIYNIAVGGLVSKGYNSIKELFDTEYAGDKVYRQLAKKQVSSWLLEKAHSSNGLTAKEYVQEKISLLKALLGTDKLSNAEQKNIEKSIKNMDFKELDTFILRLSNAENNEYSNIQKDILKNISMNNPNNNKDIGFKKIKLNSVGALLSSSTAEEKMTFDKIFKLEMGVPFNKDNSIQEYENKYLETNAIITTYNKVNEINKDLSKNISAMDGYNKYGNTTGSANEKDTLYKNLSNSILSALQKFYGNDEEKINEVLSKYNAKLENNIITFGAQGINDYAIVNMAKQIQETINTNLTTLMNGKTLEDYQNDLKSAYQMAYGSKNSVDLASKFQESQQEGVGYAKIGVSTVGIALAVLSDGTLWPLTGMFIGTFGSGMVSGIEAATKDGGMTKDEAKEIVKELVTSGILTLVGMKEGEIAAKIGHTLMESCPKFVQYIGEYGSMAVMGALTDYAVMGEISLTQETISNLINIATGIIAHRRVLSKHGEDNYGKTMSKEEVKARMEKVLMNKNLKTEDINEISDFIYKCQKKNPKLYEDITESGLLDLIESGKIDANILNDLRLSFGKEGQISENYLNDIKLMKEGKSYIKHFSENEPLQNLVNTTKIGDIVEVGNKLYINDNGQMTQINLTKEQCEKLFPIGKRFDIRQNTDKTAGNCWFLETTNNLYQNPSTRASVLKMFRAEGDNIYVSIAGSKYEYKFPQGELPNKVSSSTYTLSNSPQWVNMLEYVASLARKIDNNQSCEDGFTSKMFIGEHNGKKLIDINTVISPDSGVLTRLYGGTAKEAVNLLIGSEGVTTREYTVYRFNELSGKKLDPNDSKALKDIESELKRLEGKQNLHVNVAFGCHAYNVTKIENGKITVQDPYDTRFSLVLTFEEFLATVRYFSITE